MTFSQRQRATRRADNAVRGRGIVRRDRGLFVNYNDEKRLPLQTGPDA